MIATDSAITSLAESQINKYDSVHSLLEKCQLASNIFTPLDLAEQGFHFRPHSFGPFGGYALSPEFYAMARSGRALFFMPEFMNGKKLSTASCWDHFPKTLPFSFEGSWFENEAFFHRRCKSQYLWINTKPLTKPLSFHLYYADPEYSKKLPSLRDVILAQCIYSLRFKAPLFPYGMRIATSTTCDVNIPIYCRFTKSGIELVCMHSQTRTPTDSSGIYFYDAQRA